MRFGDLQGLTGLPVEHIRHRFRNEDVITVLPASGTEGRQTLLVATPSKAAVVVGEAPSSEHWMTFWAPWDAVRIVDDHASDDGSYGLTLSVGKMILDAHLSGVSGQRALRDFVVQVQARRAAVASA
jgi:hypothetical protein